MRIICFIFFFILNGNFTQAQWRAFGNLTQGGFPECGNTTVQTNFVNNGIVRYAGVGCGSSFFTTLITTQPLCIPTNNFTVKAKIRNPVANNGDQIGEFASYLLILDGNPPGGQNYVLSQMIADGRGLAQGNRFARVSVDNNANIIPTNGVGELNSLVYNNFNNWVIFEIRINNNKATYYVDGVRVVDNSNQPIEQTITKSFCSVLLSTSFRGNGETDWITVTDNNTNNTIFDEQFNSLPLGPIPVLCDPTCPVVVPPSVASFTIPDTVCINSNVNIVNTSQNASTYEWGFCSATSSTIPVGTNIGNSGNTLVKPAYMDLVKSNGNYYAFVVNSNPGSLVRLDFGNSPLNTPTATNLGNFGGVLPQVGSQGIQVIQRDNNWYAFIVGGDNSSMYVSRLIKLEFGLNITNQFPGVTNFGSMGSLNTPTDLRIIKDGSKWVGLVANKFNNTLTRLDFTSGFISMPVAVNLGNIGSLNSPNGLQVINDNGLWRVFVSNQGTGNPATTSLTRLDFGNSLLNNPSGTNLGNGGVLTSINDFSIVESCDGIVGYAVNGAGSNDLIKVSFPNGLGGAPQFLSLGNIAGFNSPNSLSNFFRVNNDLFSFATNLNNNTLSRIRLSGCSNSSNANSNVQNPSAISYNAAGTYYINLTVNSGMSNQSQVCKSIVVIDKIVYPNTYKTFCEGESIKLGSNITSSSYQWSTGATTDSIVISSQGKYWVTTPGPGCSRIDSFIVSHVPKPILNTGPDKQLCRGDSVSINATSNGSYSYSWSPSSYLSNAAGLNTHSFPLTNTQYILSANNNGCIGRDTINIIVNNKPVVNVGANRQLCSGDSALINASSDGSYTYSWSPVSNLSNANALTTYAFPSSNTQYILSATDGTCIGKDTLQISVGTKPVVNAGADKQLCRGDSVFINASSNGNYTYSWSPVNNLSNANTLTTYAFPVSNIQYILSASNNGCIGRDTIIINSRPTPVVNLGNDTAICTGQTLILNAQNTGSTYLWNNGNTSQVNPVLASGNYIVTVFNNGCTGKDTISVQVNQRKTFSIAPSNPAVCSGETMLLTASGADAYQWFTSSGLLNVTDSFYRATVNANRTYYVRVTDNVCKFSDTLQSQLQILPLPNIDIIKSNNISCQTPTATLSATGGTSYSWLPNQFISNTSVANPVVNPTVDTKFYVEGTGTNGCVGKDSIIVTANFNNASKIFVPSAFTPNNDGLNDCFGIKNMSATDNFELSVYNRWGVCVFKTTDSGNCWDGTYKGEKQPPGTFVYQLKISGQCGDSYNKGTLVLIR